MTTDIISHEEPQPALASHKPQTWRRFLWIVPVAVAAATFANVIFYFILTQLLGQPLLMIEQFPPPELTPMDVSSVIAFSIMFSLGASFVYAILSGVTQRPERYFIIISAVVLLASLALPLSIPTPPVAMSAKLSLVAMHIIGAIVVVGLLVRLGRKRS